MRKLLLTSIYTNKITELWDKPLTDLKLVFIPTAANTYDNRWFITADKKEWQERGVSFVEFDLVGKTQEEVEEVLQHADAVHVAGGNTFYLLEQVRKSGFDKVVKRRVEEGLIYMGGSAGALLAGPTIEPAAVMDEPEEAPGLTNYNGLSLVDYIVLPHYGHEKYKELLEATKKDWEDRGYTVIPITDDEAVLVEGDSYKVVKAR